MAACKLHFNQVLILALLFGVIHAESNGVCKEIVLRSSRLKTSANAIRTNPLIVANNVCLPRWSADPSLSLLGQGPVWIKVSGDEQCPAWMINPTLHLHPDGFDRNGNVVRRVKLTFKCACSPKRNIAARTDAAFNMPTNEFFLKS
jgi:hypothetical protein